MVSSWGFSLVASSLVCEWLRVRPRRYPVLKRLRLRLVIRVVLRGVGPRVRVWFLLPCVAYIAFCFRLRSFVVTVLSPTPRFLALRVEFRGFEYLNTRTNTRRHRPPPRPPHCQNVVVFSSSSRPLSRSLLCVTGTTLSHL